MLQNLSTLGRLGAVILAAPIVVQIEETNATFCVVYKGLEQNGKSTPSPGHMEKQEMEQKLEMETRN